ncbi:MAG: V8-like Glu-specific endopeptidase, partial [Planctomycetota bacterium]
MTLSPVKTLAVLLLLTSSALAQTAPQQFTTIPLQQDSGAVANNGRVPDVVISFPVQIAGSSWLRLYFEEVDLAGDVFAGDGAILRITSWLDGDVQELNSRHVDQWEKSTAYMNGDTVQVEVLAYPGTGTSRLKLRAVDAGHSNIQESQCGSQDNRTASSDARAARLLPVGCTGWLINDCSHCMLTAGHCTGSLGVAQFNVPLSNGNGSLNNPPAADQYAIDATSLQTNGGQGVGNDWGYFGTFPNPNTGLTAAQAQGAFYILGTPPNSTGGNDIRITGYGVDGGTANQTQQTHVGPLVNLNGNSIGYRTDTTGGNSGSPVIHEQTGDAVGIHTHGGCTSSGGNNWGTKSTHSGLQAALANPMGICSNGGIAQDGFVPELITPGVPTTLHMSMSGAPVAGTQMLHYRSSSANSFSAILMTDLGGGLYEADLPGMACGDLPEYYFSGQDSGCGTITVPENAPLDFFTVEVGVEVLTFADDFETDQGWTTSIVNATSGFWDRGTPVSDPNNAFDPTADGDGSGQCFVTGNNLGNSDVDGGSVRLVSPVLDFSGSGKNLFYRYFLNLSLPNGTDRLGVSMSDSGPGGPWITLALHEDSNGLDWTSEIITESAILAAGLTFTNTMHVRFIARDLGSNTAVEAGVDGVKVGQVTCSSSGPIGTVYCSPAVTNSTGMPGAIAASGSVQAATNDVTLVASDLPSNQFGFFLNSMMQGFAANPGGSQGNLCLAGSIGRYNMPVLSTG